MRIKSILVLTFTYVILNLSSVLAQEFSINKGVVWLEETQSPNGSWSSNLTTSFEATCVVVDTLNYLGTASVTRANAVCWIETQTVFSSRYLSQKIESLAEYGCDTTGLIGTLTSSQNEDGGFGVTPGYESDILETFLALSALQSSNYPHKSIVECVISYLLANQNDNGGFGIAGKDSLADESAKQSKVYTTSLALLTFNQYCQDYYLEEVINKTLGWLTSQQNPDGSFGSSTWETAMAYSALMEGESEKWEVGSKTGCLNYILANQLDNGSWDNDAFTTALALRALKDSAPDLAISGQNINFEPSVPVEGEPVTIKATVWNYGGTPANDVEVVIGERLSVIGRIEVGGSATVSVTETFTAGSHKIVVTVDPADKIKERDETNNTA